MSSGARWWQKSLQIAFYEIMWKNILQPDRPQMKKRRMRIACCIPKATIHCKMVARTRLFYLYLYIACLVHPVTSFLTVKMFWRRNGKYPFDKHIEYDLFSTDTD
jgi:hypothetical protein